MKIQADRGGRRVEVITLLQGSPVRVSKQQGVRRGAGLALQSVETWWN